MTAAALGFLVRWVQLLVAVALVGVSSLPLLAGRSEHPTAQAWQARTLGWTRELAVLGLLSGVVALAWQAVYLSGRPAAAVEWTSLRQVLLETRAGHVWLVRQGLLLLLAAFSAGRLATEHPVDWLAARGEAATLAAAALVLTAASSHAAAVTPGALGVMVNDGVHLLAAGLWIGGLLPLVALLRAAGREVGADARPYAVLAARRFSRLALAALIVLGISGLGNAAVHVGSVPALIGTRYGQFLIVKLAILLPILGLALVNRRRLLPALSGEGATVGRPAMRRLAAFVGAEAGLALALFAVVAAMNTTPPARHETPLWPLSFRLTLSPLPSAAGPGIRALIGSQLALLGLVALLAALVVVRRRPAMLAAAAALLVTGLGLLVPPLLVEAYPTTYVRSAVPYTAVSLAHGRARYHAYCASCHGPTAAPDGAVGTVPGGRLTDLRFDRLARTTAGDLYWWITHGLPQAGMPALAAQLGEEARWDLVNLVRALGAANAARAMGATVEPGRAWLVAPDFTFGVGPMPPRTLRDYRGSRLVVLVLYSLPGSRPRLAQLAQQYERFVGLGAEVIAVPRDADPRAIRRLGAQPWILFPVVTAGAADIVTAYDLFGGGSHAEFLIDRQGFIRARWIARGQTRRDVDLLLAEIQRLNEEKAPAADADEHVH